jgi:hypothetical protein
MAKSFLLAAEAPRLASLRFSYLPARMSRHESLLWSVFALESESRLVLLSDRPRRFRLHIAQGLAPAPGMTQRLSKRPLPSKTLTMSARALGVIRSARPSRFKSAIATMFGPALTPKQCGSANAPRPSPSQAQASLK